jgi:RimJ/RimL family protein N-acetyltransferase
LRWYFEHTKAPNIFAFIDVENKRSIRAHEKIGFKIADSFMMTSPDSCCLGRTLYRMICTQSDFLLYFKEKVL